MTDPRWPVVLFDLDGTVADTIGLILASYAHATRSVLGEAAPEDEARSWIGQTLIDTFTRRYPGREHELFDAYVTWNLAHLDSLVRRYDGMDALLADLDAAGVRTGIVTSKRRPSADKTLSAVGLADAIGVLATLEDTQQHKPAPDPLLHALDVLGVPAQDCVYVGDATVDLQSARAAGLDAIGVTWGAGIEAELTAERPLAVVGTVDALRALLLP